MLPKDILIHHLQQFLNDKDYFSLIQTNKYLYSCRNNYNIKKLIKIKSIEDLSQYKDYIIKKVDLSKLKNNSEYPSIISSLQKLETIYFGNTFNEKIDNLPDTVKEIFHKVKPFS
jgi:hypothetical protein